MRSPSPQDSGEKNRRHLRPSHQWRMVVLGLILLGVVVLWVGLVATGAVSIDLVRDLPHKTIRVLSTDQPVPTSGVVQSSSYLILFHTNDTLGYVDPCA